MLNKIRAGFFNSRILNFSFSEYLHLPSTYLPYFLAGQRRKRRTSREQSVANASPAEDRSKVRSLPADSSDRDSEGFEDPSPVLQVQDQAGRFRHRRKGGCRRSHLGLVPGKRIWQNAIFQQTMFTSDNHL